MSSQLSRPIMSALALALCVTMSGSSASAAFRFCMEPRAPSAFLSKPSKPYCAASRTCTSYDVSRYKSEIDTYFRNLKDYAYQVDRYYKSAGEYVECMADLD